MPQLPWELDFATEGMPAGVRMEWAYDPASERLSASVVNEGGGPAAL